MKMKTIITLWISPLKNPKGGIYRHQEKGGQGTNPGPKHWRGHASTAKPRFYGCTRTTRAVLPAVRCRVGLLSVVPSRFLNWAPWSDRITS